MDSKIKSLLNLQDIDVECIKLESQLNLLPNELKSLEEKIADTKAGQKKARDQLKNMEVVRQDLDRQLQEAEDKITKLKTKQIDVKKNEEYHALNNEIDHQIILIGKLEDKQLELLESMDQLHAEFKKTEEADNLRIVELEGQIGLVKKKELELRTRIQGMSGAIDEASRAVDAAFLKKYERVKKQVKRGPFVVVLKDGRCQGCHLTVSNDVVSAVRHAEQPEQCPNCSRLLYWGG